jgi:hypothetical protein
MLSANRTPQRQAGGSRLNDLFTTGPRGANSSLASLSTDGGAAVLVTEAMSAAHFDHQRRRPKCPALKRYERSSSSDPRRTKSRDRLRARSIFRRRGDRDLHGGSRAARSHPVAAIRTCPLDCRLRNFIWRQTDDGRCLRYADLMRTSGGETIPEEAAVALGYYEVPCVACVRASMIRRREPQLLAGMTPSDVCPSCLGSGRNWNRLGRIPLSDDAIVELCRRPAPETPMKRR